MLNTVAYSLSPTLRELIAFAATSSVLLLALFSLFRAGRRSNGLPPGKSYESLTRGMIGLRSE